MCELEYEKAEIMLESYEEYSALEEKANVLRTYVEDTELFNEDAAKQAAEKKQSLVKKAWDAVINFLKTIKEKVYEAIDKIKCKINPNAKVYAVPKEYADKGNISKLNQCIEKIKSITSSTPFKAVIAITIAIAGVCALYKIKKQGKVIIELNNQLDDEWDKHDNLSRENNALRDELNGTNAVAEYYQRAYETYRKENDALSKRNVDLAKSVSESNSALNKANNKIRDLQKDLANEVSNAVSASREADHLGSMVKRHNNASKILDSDYANSVKSASKKGFQDNKLKDVAMVSDRELKQLAATYHTSVDRLIKAAQVAWDSYKTNPRQVAMYLNYARSHGVQGRDISRALRETGAYPKNAYDIEEAGPDDGNISGVFTKLRGGINDLARTLKSIGDDLLKLRMKGNK